MCPVDHECALCLEWRHTSNWLPNICHTVEVTYPNYPSPIQTPKRTIFIDFCCALNGKYFALRTNSGETIVFVHKAKYFPFNVQQNIYEYHCSDN